MQVAVQHEVTARWCKSSASGVNNCVEVRIEAGAVQIRDSKDLRGPVLTFTLTEWQAFLTGVHSGEFDLSSS
jgi:hypothetical protein